MNLNHLSYFRVLAKLEHYTQAAEELSITQPSLSHAMSTLEKDLGTYLFEKQGRNMWTWWPNSEVGHTQEATKEIKSLFADTPNIFDFPKPT